MHVRSAIRRASSPSPRNRWWRWGWTWLQYGYGDCWKWLLINHRRFAHQIEVILALRSLIWTFASVHYAPMPMILKGFILVRFDGFLTDETASGEHCLHGWRWWRLIGATSMNAQLTRQQMCCHFTVLSRIPIIAIRIFILLTPAHFSDIYWTSTTTTFDPVTGCWLHIVRVLGTVARTWATRKEQNV